MNQEKYPEFVGMGEKRTRVYTQTSYTSVEGNSESEKIKAFALKYPEFVQVSKKLLHRWYVSGDTLINIDKVKEAIYGVDENRATATRYKNLRAEWSTVLMTDTGKMHGALTKDCIMYKHHLDN